MAQKRSKRSNLSFPFSPRRILGGSLVGLGGLLLILLILVLPVWTRLDCDRSVTQLITCRLRQANLLGIPWRQQKIAPMIGAEINLQSYKEGYRYRTSVFTYSDEFPLAPFSVSERQASQAKEQVLDFVSNQTVPKFSLSYRVPWILFATALVFALLLLGLGSLLVYL